MKHSIIIFSLLFQLGLTGFKVIEKEQNRPNILFIMSDDHTSQAWGIYGGILKDYVHTPSISRLAEEGCVLENCLVSNSICTPSRATILTGQYSHVNGVKTLGDDLFPEQENIAKVLQRSGYQTSIIGKWHLHKEPAGFDYYCVLPGQGRYWDPLMKTRDNWEDNTKGGRVYKGFSTDVITGMTIDWIENRDKSKPFLAMCHFKATHEPFDYPERFSHLYRDTDIPAPITLYDEGPETTGRSFRGQSIDNLTKRLLQASVTPDKDKKGFNTSHGFWDFFDLEKDPNELHNAYEYPQYQKIIKDMKEELIRQRKILGDTDKDNPEILEIIANHWND